MFDQVCDRKHYLAVTHRLLSSCVKSRFSLIDKLGYSKRKYIAFT